MHLPLPHLALPCPPSELEEINEHHLAGRADEVPGPDQAAGRRPIAPDTIDNTRSSLLRCPPGPRSNACIDPGRHPQGFLRSEANRGVYWHGKASSRVGSGAGSRSDLVAGVGGPSDRCPSPVAKDGSCEKSPEAEAAEGLGELRRQQPLRRAAAIKSRKRRRETEDDDSGSSGEAGGYSEHSEEDGDDFGDDSDDDEGDGRAAAKRWQRLGADPGLLLAIKCMASKVKADLGYG